ncbi:methionine ABC transporter ATP-binding protein [Arthrobacter sp. JSM 101049]|uniref:methionine ABC transporter ATP-binding protein n=1 Tax=Arthrobacter sp. JSM 101049 TaxID=929097 RepID=UPI00356204A9
MTSIVSFRNVSKAYPGRGAAKGKPVHALRDVTFDIEKGSITGVIGYSGAGKSTLVRLINALELPTGGSLVVNDRELTGMGERQLRGLRGGIGMIFQQFNLFNSRTVAKNVEYPLIVAGWPKAERAARVAELLEFVGIADKARQFPSQLSGGQKQRVGIARALATNPELLLADEATSALDPETTTEVLSLLKRVNEEFGTTVVVITHEMHVVRSICDHVAVMEQGSLLEHGHVYDVFAFAQNPATRKFISSTIADKPSPDTVARLQELHPGRLVTITISEAPGSGAGSNQRDISSLLASYPAVHDSVVYGSVTEIAQRPFGSLTYVLEGPDADLDALIEGLSHLTTVQQWPVATAGGADDEGAQR